MTRTIVIILAVVTLVVGVAVGIGAGAALQGNPGAVAVVATPSGDPAATDSESPGDVPTDSAGTETPSASPATPTPEPTPTPVPTPVLVPAPLTGVPVKPAVAKRHVIAVMIDDLFAARPQSGLSRASVVWQAPAEGGIPRYMALFQETDPPSVGPIRSSRLYFISWASEWQSVYVHVGGSPQALALLKSAQGRGKYVYNADQFRWSKYLYRVKWRYAPHNVYSDAKNLRRLANAVNAKSAKTVPAPKWQFAPDLPLAQRPTGSTITVPYLANRIAYAYDRKTNTYKRSVSVEGKQIDKGTKERIAPKNVVVMFVSFAPLNDGSKKHRLEAKVTGSGKAWISTNGKTIKGTWKKKAFNAPTLFFDKDGKPVTLTIGQTFVQVVPIGTKVTYKNGKVPAPAPGSSPTPSPSSSPSL
jgi:hypothetical protein